MRSNMLTSFSKQYDEGCYPYGNKVRPKNASIKTNFKPKIFIIEYKIHKQQSWEIIKILMLIMSFSIYIIYIYYLNFKFWMFKLNKKEQIWLPFVYCISLKTYLK